MTDSPETGPTVYAVRVAERAREALIRERDRRTEMIGATRAADWYDDILTAIRSLATYPQRCALAPENDLLPEAIVRHLLYPQKRGPAWRFLFTVHEANLDDPPTVRIHHVRHSAQSSLTEWQDDDTH